MERRASRSGFLLPGGPTRTRHSTGEPSRAPSPRRVRLAARGVPAVGGPRRRPGAPSILVAARDSPGRGQRDGRGPWRNPPVAESYVGKYWSLQLRRSRPETESPRGREGLGGVMGVRKRGGPAGLTDVAAMDHPDGRGEERRGRRKPRDAYPHLLRLWCAAREGPLDYSVPASIRIPRMYPSSQCTLPRSRERSPLGWLLRRCPDGAGDATARGPSPAVDRSARAPRRGRTSAGAGD